MSLRLPPAAGLAVLVTALGLAGCGDDDPESGPTPRLADAIAIETATGDSDDRVTGDVTPDPDDADPGGDELLRLDSADPSDPSGPGPSDTAPERPDDVLADSSAPPEGDLGPQEDTDAPPAGLTLAEAAWYFAPMWYQDTANNGPDGQGARADLPTRVDYDGDLVHNNNWDNLPGAALQAWLYWGGAATPTHWFLNYSHYHPRDWDQLCTGLFTECHEGDLEYVQLVVRRTRGGEIPGVVELIRTHHHGETSTWSEAPDVTGTKTSIVDGGVDFESDDGSISATQDAAHHRVRIFAEAKGHGLAPCKAGEQLIKPFGILLLSCPDGEGGGFPGGDGLRLTPTQAEPPIFEAGLESEQGTLPYGLVAVHKTLWQWRDQIGVGQLWRDDTAFTYAGSRGAPFVTAKPIGGKFDADQFINDDSSGRSPWDIGLEGSAHGDAFLDPAWAFAQAFTFPEPYDTEYTQHPYLPGATEPPDP